MSTPASRSDAILAHLSPNEVREALRAIDFLEWSGVLSRAQATEWRARFTDWAASRFGVDSAREAG